MIKHVAIKSYKLHFRQALKIAYEAVEAVEVIIVKITDQQGNFGLGCAAPDSFVTQETIPQLSDVLRRKLNKNFFDLPLDNWYGYHQKIQSVFSGLPSAQTAVEEAVLNLFVNRHHITLVHLFGGYRQAAIMSVTIGIQNLAETLLDVKQRLKQGFQSLKLKGGLDLKGDLLRIKAVRQLVPLKIKVAFDANQGYTFSEAKRLLQTLKGSNISFIEQPVKAADRAGLKKLRQLKCLPIIGDEAIISYQDALELLSGDYVDGVNIKLMKCGGPINFIKIFHLAKSLGKMVMIGCMYESNISITTGASLAMALPIDVVELDSGHFDHDDDPAQGGAIFSHGLIKLGKKLSLK